MANLDITVCWYFVPSCNLIPPLLQGRVKADVMERKAGENVDNTQWKNTFQLEKTGEEEFFSGTRVCILVVFQAHVY